MWIIKRYGCPQLKNGETTIPTLLYVLGQLRIKPGTQRNYLGEAGPVNLSDFKDEDFRLKVEAMEPGGPPLEFMAVSPPEEEEVPSPPFVGEIDQKNDGKLSASGDDSFKPDIPEHDSETPDNEEEIPF